MDEAKYGEHKKSGFVPNKLISYGPLFSWPIKFIEIIKWLPSYLISWHTTYTVIGIAFWFALMPPIEDMATFEFGWIAYLFAINMVFVVVWFGGWHLWFYMLKRQRVRFKYNARWPSIKNAAFVFGRQHADNVFWSLASGVPIYTAYMVVGFWLFANGYVPYLSFEENPIWFIALLLLIPMIGEFHFFVIHRLIHVPFLYKHVHSLHHNNVNPAPWSGLSMHPVEHLLYFSGMVMVLLINAHPMHMLAYAIRLSLGPAVGHTGFDKLELGETKGIDTGVYAHYLHHKLFEVNYADGVIPLDKWFGSFHDGSPEADARLKARMKKRKEAYAKTST